MSVTITVDGREVVIDRDDISLLEALREHLDVRSPKDGCSPQGQCGCCTVLVDGQARVACVTPLRRVAGRAITTLDGLDPAERAAWVDAFVATGASQCGFCTPGIVVRLAAGGDKVLTDRGACERALAAHLCRCTGWQTILEAVERRATETSVALPARDLAAAARRATLEGRAPQSVGAEVVLGAGGFAEDGAPSDALVAVPDGHGGFALGDTLAEARAAAGKVQGRRTTVPARPPIEVAPGDWALTLRTSWVEPAYLEPDASWCEPGGVPASPLGNGGAFGGKSSSPVAEVARRLADECGRAVRVVWAREDAVRWGPKRPPLAAALRADGTGVVRVARTPGVAERIAAVLPAVEVVEIDVPGPPTSVALRGAGWVEAAVLRAVLDVVVADGPPPAGAATPWIEVRDPFGGGVGRARVGADGAIDVAVAAGEVLDAVVLRSYAIGAAHQALSWVTSEALAVTDDGDVEDLTIRSFGIVRAGDTPPVSVAVVAEDTEAVNGSDAVLAAVAAAVWLHRGLPPQWPTAG
jgi:xanthine dehydrogenase small subunit